MKFAEFMSKLDSTLNEGVVVMDRIKHKDNTICWQNRDGLHLITAKSPDSEDEDVLAFSADHKDIANKWATIKKKVADRKQLNENLQFYDKHSHDKPSDHFRNDLKAITTAHTAAGSKFSHKVSGTTMQFTATTKTGENHLIGEWDNSQGAGWVDHTKPDTGDRVFVGLNAKQMNTNKPRVN